MKKLLSKALIVSTICLTFFSTSIYGQTQVDFGESLTGTLPTTSSTATYTTPHLAPGDVVFIRVTPFGLQAQMEFRAPSGSLISTIPGSFNSFFQEFYTVPADGEAGHYEILISNTGIWTGEFCLSLQRMNEPPTAVFLGCNASLDDGLECRSSIRAYQFLVQENTRSRITIVPRGMIPEAWICNPAGDILRYGVTSFGNTLIIDTIAAPETGCYYVLVADGDGYWDNEFSISHTIISGGCATVSAQSSPADGSLCVGEDITLTASSPLPGATFSWSGPVGFTSADAEITITEATPAHSGEYIVTATVPGICSSTASQSVTVHPLPSVEASTGPASGVICEEEDIEFSVATNATSPITYDWSRLGGGHDSPYASHTIYDAEVFDSDTYVISVTDGNGCSNADSIDIIVNPLPLAFISSPPDGEVCREEDLFLKVATDADDAGFLWSGPQGFSSTVQAPVVSEVTFSNEGFYRVTVTNNTTGCRESTNAYIDVNNRPSAYIFGDLSICAGESAELRASGGGTYDWPTGGNTASITVSPAETTTYTVTVTNTSTGCTDTESATVEVLPLPSIALSSMPEDPEICSGEGAILLCATSGTDNPQYQWTGPALFSSQQCVSLDHPAQSGAVHGKVTNGVTGCSNEDSILVNIHSSPAVDLLADPPGLAYCDGEGFTLCANSDATAPAYQWTGPGAFTGSTLCVAINDAGTAQAGNYEVAVTDIHGCTGTDALVVAVNPPIGLEVEAEGNQVTALASGGTPPFEYSIAPGGETNTTGIFSGLAPGGYTITATDYFGCTASSAEVVVANSIVEPSSAWGFSVTPNPGNGRFEVRAAHIPGRGLQLAVYDVNGRRLKASAMNTRATTLDIAGQPAGMYILRISDGERAGAMRLVVLKP